MYTLCMGRFNQKDSDTVELMESGIELSVGDIVKTENNLQYEILGFSSDGYVNFKFVGDERNDVNDGKEGADLLSVWDNRFRKQKYKII